MKLNKNKSMAKKFIFNIFKSIILYTTIYFLIWIAICSIYENYIWYQNDNILSKGITRLLVSFRYNLSVILFFWMLGCFIILIIYVIKNSQNMLSIINASEELVSYDDAWIKLPKSLRDIEIKMNDTKQKFIKNYKLAKESEQRKNDLIVYLAHDLKTPLTSIIGYLELLKETPDLPLKQRRKYTDITLDKAYRLEELTNEFFEIARFNADNVMLLKKNIDIKFMLEQIVDEFYPLITDENKKIIIKCDEKIICYADPNKLSRALNNVIKNAICYSFENSEIMITVRENKNGIMIDIKNEGYTIPKDKLNVIFEKFYRVDEARNTNTGGAGVGLAIAKEIINLHGGKIEARSEQNITEFIISIPRYIKNKDISKKNC